MHPYMKLEIDEDVSERALIDVLFKAGFEITIDGDTGTIKVKVGRVTDPASGQALPTIVRTWERCNVGTTNQCCLPGCLQGGEMRDEQNMVDAAW